MQQYKEQDFETYIVEHLTTEDRGTGRYIHRHSADYDKDLCLLPDEVLTFIRDSQPEQYKALQGQYGKDTDRNLLNRISGEIQKWGTLQVLRKGVRDRGCRFDLVYFRPSSGMNPEHKVLYGKNRFSVVRQLRFSKKNPNDALDLALFINGIPIITAELKNSLTGQFVEHAVKQYKRDRDPKEPLFQFRRCLVHFAVGNEKVFMTTRLAGDKTFFLPFNRDIENPVNPQGHQTSYLWEDTWSKDTLLDLLQNYLHLHVSRERVYDDRKEEVIEKEKEVLIFPRYHQLDVVRRLLHAARAEGVGHNYLIQHSAGSGKSNSIAWLAHGLSRLYRSESDTERLFDTIIVVVDRKVLDRQLQDTIKQFEQVKGVVVPIDATSAQLRDALEKGKDIIISTVQKFGMISENMTKIPGKRFAVIIDEAHSGQSGETSKHLKKTLSAGLEEAEKDDQEEFDLEDEIIQEIRSRGKQTHISYFAFTATPKSKSIEVFGRKDEQGRWVPFHVYSMKQAIAEGFILDVLRNYTTFKRYFKLVKSVEDDREYEKDKAVRALTSYVDLTEHAVETKSSIILDHFMDVTEHAITGRGRAMVVTRSRLHAVRYYQILRRLLKEKGVTYKPLVAFSGTVKDPDTGDEHTENSLNQLPPGVSIEQALKLPEYRMLVVASKYQTGFDEPLLSSMYLDRRLGGVQAVQTLSRLNRTTTGKVETFVLDFVNDADEIQQAFQPYYQTTYLTEETDPNKLYDLSSELEQMEVYTTEDVNDFAEVFFYDSKPGELLQPILDRVIQQWRTKEEDARETFRSTLQSFVRLYGYVGQLVTFQDVDLEKVYVFARNLNLKLPKRTGAGLPVEVLDEVDLDSFRIQRTFEGSLALNLTDAEIPGIPTGVGGHGGDDERDYLSKIITTLNETYGLDLDERDKIRVEQIIGDVTTDESVRDVMTGPNSTSNKKHHVEKVIDSRILSQVNESIGLYQKLTDPRVNETFKRRLFDRLVRQFTGATEV